VKAILCRRYFFIAAFFTLIHFNLPAAPAESPRERLLLDFGWKFHLGNEWGIAQNLAKAGTGSGPAASSFGDSSWRTVNLPHDWAVELPFDRNSDTSHGFKPVGPGFATNSVAWYRRTFDLPKEDAGKRLWLEFDGVYRDCMVFVNGWFIGHHEGGYNGFRYDITDVANAGGKNVVAVKVDASQFEGWFYEGAGIYRHTWLVKTAPVAIAPDGIFVSSRPPNGCTVVEIQAQIQNTKNIQTYEDDNVYVNFEIIDPSGKSVGEFRQRVGQPVGKDAFGKDNLELKANSQQQVKAYFNFYPPNSAIRMPSPTPRDQTKDVFAMTELWSPESPKLYKLITKVEIMGGGVLMGSGVVDQKETTFGIRTVAFDKDKGFLLNGKPYVLKGTCNHQDAGGVGAALPDDLQYFRIAKLKEMGDNALRTSHNPPTPELIEACDQLGMIVMDESRLLGSDEENLKKWEAHIRRDRNHASVGLWSVANEEFTVQSTPQAANVTRTMQNLVKSLDPTRPVTYPAPQGDTFDGINGVIEVRGWNYNVGTNMDRYHAKHPDQPNVGTEQGSTVSTRGIYENDKARGYVSAYDANAPSWAHTAETWWSYFADRPWLSGGFVWTGFDYRGEPTPYGWPCINSHFGILDMCGFPKDNFWYYQSWWTTNIVLHLLPHWNWAGKEGQELRVDALSNCEEVELFLNGASLGKQSMKRNSKLSWQVKYAPGVVSAKGYKGGKVVAETKVETTGEPAAVQLTPNRAAINANGEDLSILTVSVTDAQGRIVPVAGNLIHFELSGPGKILGVGNGDPSCHEPDVFVAHTPGRSVAINDGWRWKKVENVRNSKIAEFQTSFDDATWEAAKPQSGSGPLNGNEQAVFRKKISLTGQDLAAAAVELRVGMIDEDGWVYVNGQKSGESHDWQSPPVFDLKPFLHAGENTIAIGVANWDSEGGLNKGVSLEFQEKPVAADWKRSVFNGLAQIIVQSTKEPGEIKLTASAEGLSPVTTVISSQPSTPRPSVP
jgi:beta-galactosidase